MIKRELKKSRDFDADTSGHEFKIRYLVCLVAVLFALLALLTYSPEDFFVVGGGVPGLVRNWIGPAGAKFSCFMLLNFGLSCYVLMTLLLLRAVRLFMSRPGRNSLFIYGTLLIWFGLLLLFGLEPEVYAPLVSKLNLGRIERPMLALPGGVLGQFLAAPPCEELPAGILPGIIGVVGTMVCGWVFTVAGITLCYMNDWYNVVRHWMLGRGDEKESRGRRLSGLHDTVSDEDDYDDEDDFDDEDEPEEPESPRKEELPVPGNGKSRLSRLQEMFRLGEEAGDGENANEKEPEQDIRRAASTRPGSLSERLGELFPDGGDDAVEENKAADALPAERAGSTPAGKTSGVMDNPEVGKKVVQSGERLRGEFGDFVLPPVSMLAQGTNVIGENRDAIELATSKIQQTLDDFSIAGRVTGFVSGPRVTRYEITLDPGISVRKVEQIQDNIRMSLAATSIRVLAPIPGRSVVGIEVSNTKPEAVFMRSVMESEEWKRGKAEIPLALGKNVSGKPVILDLAKAPHMLVAGSTGTGKSVCSNSLIMSMLFRFRPDELRLIMVDPKIVEFDAYKKLPHLLTPIINDSAKVPIALRWAANEMDRRYHVLAKVGVKKLSEFNSRPIPDEPEYDDDGKVIPEKMPLLVIILDELADLMMTEAKKDVETNITRIAQKGRAAGIHIIVATQRPSTNIITGVIKANLPTRLCFQVRSLIDSRVVLDTPGAEKLLGTGDMLVMTSSSMEIERVQGAWVQDDDIKKVVQFISDQAPQRFNDNVLVEDTGDGDVDVDEEYEVIDNDDRADIAPLIKKYLRPDDDDTFRRALEVVILDRKASTSYFQRRLKIGYNRAAEIVDQMEDRGILGPPSGSGNKRDILVFDGIDIGE